MVSPLGRQSLRAPSVRLAGLPGCRGSGSNPQRFPDENASASPESGQGMPAFALHPDRPASQRLAALAPMPPKWGYHPGSPGCFMAARLAYRRTLIKGNAIYSEFAFRRYRKCHVMQPKCPVFFFDILCAPYHGVITLQRYTQRTESWRHTQQPHGVCLPGPACVRPCKIIPTQISTHRLTVLTTSAIVRLSDNIRQNRPVKTTRESDGLAEKRRARQRRCG